MVSTVDLEDCLSSRCFCSVQQVRLDVSVGQESPGSDCDEDGSPVVLEEDEGCSRLSKWAFNIHVCSNLSVHNTAMICGGLHFFQVVVFKLGLETYLDSFKE